jgi:hypothetical protein
VGRNLCHRKAEMLGDVEMVREFGIMIRKSSEVLQGSIDKS